MILIKNVIVVQFMSNAFPSVDSAPMPSQRPAAFESMVADAVSAVRKNGDVLDDPQLKRWAMANGGLLGGVAMASAFGTVGVSGEATAAAVAVSIAAGMAGTFVSERLSRNRYETQAKAEEAIQEEFGITTEFFFDRDTNEVGLRWYTPDHDLEPFQLAAGLTLLEAMAECQRIGNVTVPVAAVASLLDEYQLRRAETQVDWLETRNGFSVDDAKQTGQVVALSPIEIKIITEKARLMETKLVESHHPIDSVMHILRQVRPHHPALKYHGTEKPEAADKKLRRVLKMSVESTLSGVESRMGTDEDALIRRKVHLAGCVEVSKDGQMLARYHSLPDMRQERTDDLLADLKLSTAKLADMLTHWDKYPVPQVVKACELAGLLVLEGHPLEIPPIEGARRKIEVPTSQKSRIINQPPSTETAFQKRLRARLPMIGSGRTGISLERLRFRRARRSIAALGLAAATGVGIVGTGGLAMAGVASLLENEGYQPESDLSAREALSPVSTASTNSGIGNVPTGGENESLFYITSYGGAETEGYWSQAVSDSLEYGSDQEGLNSISWDVYIGRSEFDGSRAERLVSPASLDLSEPLIKSEAQFTANRADNLVGMLPNGEICIPEMAPQTNPDSCDGQLLVLLPAMPVLEGNRIMAAKITNGDVSYNDFYLLADDANMQRIAMPHDDYMKLGAANIRLEYWLAENQVQVSGVRADGPVRFADELGDAPAEMESFWENTLPADTPFDWERVRHQQEALRHLQYEVAPLSPEEVEDIESIGELAEATFELGQANCNTANTLLVTSNPEDLNYVTGFYNRDTDEQREQGQMYLSSREAHAWSVDDWSVEWDATPVNGAKDDAAFFEENYNARTLDNQNPENDARLQRALQYIAVAGGVALGSLAVAKGRHLPAAAVQGVAKKRTKSLDAGELNRARQILDHALYARQGDRFSPLVDVQQEPYEILARFRDLADRDYKSTRMALRQAKGSFAGYRAHNRRTRRILRSVR